MGIEEFAAQLKAVSLPIILSLKAFMELYYDAFLLEQFGLFIV